MNTICGVDCSQCPWRETCHGCRETDGHPFGGPCVAAQCYKEGGEGCFACFKKEAIDAFNGLNVAGMPKVEDLFQLAGAYVNLEYTLPGGQKTKLLDDRKIYLGCQLEKADSHRCFGLIADEQILLVCEYGCGGSDPEILVFRKR